MHPNGVEPPPRRRDGVRIIAYETDPSATEFAHLYRAVEQAHVTVPVAETFPLGRADQAHARLERGHVVGRIVLQIR